jgi:ATP-dependent helicase/DNAse subunit B
MPKDEKVLSELNRFLVEDGTLSTLSYLSPSAINTYLSCTLRFYFRYIARLKAPDEIAEDVDGLLLGNLLHRTMESLYNNKSETNIITAEWLNALLNNHELIKNCLDKALAKEYYHRENLPAEAGEDGKLVLLREVVEKYVRKIIRYDIRQTPFTLEGAELPFRYDFPFKAGETIRQVRLGGVIDRLDRQGNRLFVVDYKTGKLNNKFKSIAALFGADVQEHNPAALQIMLYSTLLKQQHPDRGITPKLYFMRELYNDSDFLITETSSKQSITEITPYMESYTAALAATLSEIFNPQLPFAPTTHTDSCTLCDYRRICNATANQR